MNIIVNHFLLILGFVFTFFVPGYVIIQTFFSYLPKIVKVPLVMLLSVLTSTYLVYILSLFLGYSRFSILITFALFVPWFIFIFKKKQFFSFLKVKDFKEHLIAILISVLIFFIFYAALYPGIFTKHDQDIVMSSVNWQDTAMHQSLIETLSQGNFPPQAPYFSGHPLQYYYFIDLHSSILEVLYNQFFPRVLVYDNPFFVFIFALSVYTLCFYLTKNKVIAILSILIVIFNSNYMFVKFLSDLFILPHSNLLHNAFDLISTRGYTMEYRQLIQMTPMVDYFLQNRPMMIGLPATTLIAYLVFFGYSEKKLSTLILAGFITGMLIKFQLFAFGVSILTFILISILFLKKENYKLLLNKVLLFGLPILLFTVLFTPFSKTEKSLTNSLSSSLFLGPWDKREFFWYIKFYLLNFGLPFVTTVISLILFILKKGRQSYLIFLFSWIIVLFFIPHLVRFTIYEGDMFKFFYFMMIPVAIVSGSLLFRLQRFKTLGLVFLILFFTLSSFTATLTLLASFTNKNIAYENEEYQAGLWIRENTPQKVVFLELPRVHSAVSDIGGRLRALSYINWPHSHGFNIGDDNVFTRLDLLENLYLNANDHTLTSSIMEKFKAEYILFGLDEKARYPFAPDGFSTNPNLVKVFQKESVIIYKLK